MANAPSPAEIRAIRQELGLSVSGLADALGYTGQERLVRALEASERGGEPCVMTGSAAAALRYLRGIAKAVWRYQSGVPAPECVDGLRELLPEELR